MRRENRTYFCLGYLIFIMSLSAEQGEDQFIKLGHNKYKIQYHYQTAMRMIPHGVIDQAKDSIISIYGVDKIISYERSIRIGSNTYGYIAHKGKDGVEIYLIACSKGNISFVIVSGTCKKGDWRFDLIKLLEISTKELEKNDIHFVGVDV
ncbi:MAG: hypothetical protein JXB26_14415 [Candidatus Aminicenantes bacterium]|nr:hypothetical protein [Candidatus Aminicenantes bacterium]